MFSLFKKKKDIYPEIEEIEKEIEIFLNHPYDMWESIARETLVDTIRLAIRKNPNYLVSQIRTSDGRTSKEWFYSMIANISGELLESGKYHFYRGLLDNTGKRLLIIFESSLDVLIEMNAKGLDVSDIEEQKRLIRNSIRQIG